MGGKTMKKALCWLLCCLLLTGCHRQTLPTVPDPGMTLPIFPDREEYYADHDASVVVGGRITTGLAENAPGTVS